MDSDTVVNDDGSIVLSDDLASDTADTDLSALLDISDEDAIQSSAYGDIESLDTDITDITADYLDEGMAENVGESAPSDSEVPGEGFSDVVVSINDAGVDVVVNATELSEAQRAQIEDIITRKTGVSPETIIISTMAAE